MDSYEEQNSKLLKETGFWGKEGAGAILFSPERGKFGLGLRSVNVEEPGTIGTFGGAIDGDDDIKRTVLKELEEEVSVFDNTHLIELCTFSSDNFKYHNFLAVIDDSLFFPQLNWENDELLWLSLDEIKESKIRHFGLDFIINDEFSLNKLTKIENAAKDNDQGFTP